MKVTCATAADAAKVITQATAYMNLGRAIWGFTFPRGYETTVGPVKVEVRGMDSLVQDCIRESQAQVVR